MGHHLRSRGVGRPAIISLLGIMLLCICANSVAQNLVAHWPMDESSGSVAADISGNGNDANFPADPTWRAGIVDGAVLLNGTSDVAAIVDDIPNHSLDVSGTLTVAAWVNPNSLVFAQQNMIVSKDNAYEFRINARNAGTWDIRLNNASGLIVVIADTRLTLNTWQHIAATWDGTNVTYYLEGVADGGYVLSGPLNQNNSDIGIGGRPSGSHAVDGSLDDVRVYDRVLSGDEIRDLVALANADDTTPPLRANGQPGGTLSAGTSDVTLSLDTDERAICRFDTVPGTPFAAMPTQFAVTDQTGHSHPLTGLSGGQGYSYYVRCEDIVGNGNTDDFQIAFSIDADTPPGFHPIDIDPLMFYIESTFFENSDNRARSIADCNTQQCFDAPDNTSIDMQYCDTVIDGNSVFGARGIAPHGCIRRWEDMSGYLSTRNAMFPGELLTGRDFGQDDKEKPIYVPNCINGHPCARGVPSSPPEFPQNTSFEIENADGFGNAAEPPTGSPPDEGLAGEFSIFHLARPVAQAENWWYFGCGALRGLRHNVADNSLHYQCGGGGENPCTNSGDITGADAVELDTWQLIEIHRDAGNDVQVVINGEDKSILPKLNASGDWCYHDVTSRVKGQNASFGDLAASAVYDRNLTESERADIRGYLNGVYRHLGGQPKPPEPVPARGYQSRACGFDMDDDLVYGEPEDCNVGDGVTTDPDNDGILEDLLYVDCDAGSDITGDGSPGNPFASIGHAYAVADGPSDGSEDIIAFSGVCHADNIAIDNSGIAGFKVRLRSGSEARDFQYPNNPAMLIGWDRDNDGAYPPHDLDDTSVLFGGEPLCATHALKFDLSAPVSHIEIAHFQVMEYGACDPYDTGSGFMQHKTASNEVSSHHYYHDLSIVDVNKAEENGESATIIHSLFNGGYLKWAAWENEEIIDAAGYSYRGSSGDQNGTAGPYRFQGTTRTCFGNGVNENTGTLCTGWKLWNHTSQIEIIDQYFDMNIAAGWTVKNSIANVFSGVPQCLQDVVIRNNEAHDVRIFINMNGYDDGGCNLSAGGIEPRPTKDILVEANIWRNTYNWDGGSFSQGSCFNLTNCNDFNSSIQDVTIVNNFCSTSQPAGMMVQLNCLLDAGENPGSWIISGNTFVAEGDLQWGAIYQDTTGGGAFREEDIEFRNNTVIVPPGVWAMNLKLPIDRLLSDYNTFSPGAKFKFENIDTGNTLAAWQAASGMDGNSVSCNPVMVDRASGDLHLDPSDQCAIDWGTSLSHVTLGDIDGDSRPQGVAWDVGADEAMPGGEPPADTTPPLRSNGQPAGALPAGTTQIDISLVSNEAALCRYSTIPGVDFDAMGSSFTVSGGTSHQETISGLQNGNAYTYYVRCQDSSANANTDDFVINFSVNLPVDITPPMISAISSSTATSQTVRITVNWTTDEPASSQVEYGTSPALGSFTAVDAVLKTQHTVLIDCLDRRTTYHFRVISADVAGNSNASASQSIRTSGKKPKGSC